LEHLLGLVLEVGAELELGQVLGLLIIHLEGMKED